MQGGNACSECGYSKERCCGHCGCCDQCALRQLGYSVNATVGELCLDVAVGFAPWTRSCASPIASHGASAACSTVASHGSTRYLLTNTLEVTESSAGKVIELVTAFQGRDHNGKGINAETVYVTPEKLRELVLRALLGSTEVLRQSFPPRAVTHSRRNRSSSHGAANRPGSGGTENHIANVSVGAALGTTVAIEAKTEPMLPPHRELSLGGCDNASDHGSDGDVSFEMEQWVSELIPDAAS